MASKSSEDNSLWWKALLGGSALLVALGIGYRHLTQDEEEEDDDYEDDDQVAKKKRAAAAKKGKGGGHQPNEKVDRLIAFARAASQQGQFDKSIRACTEALKIMEGIPSYQHTVARAETNFVLFESSLKLEAQSGSMPSSNNNHYLYTAKQVIDSVGPAERRQPNFLLTQTLIYCNLTEILVQSGDNSSAEALGDDALKLIRRIFPNERNHNVATIEFTVATAKLFNRKYNEAEKLFQSAYDVLSTQSQEPNQPMVIQVATRLANCLNQNGKHKQSEALLKKHLKLAAQSDKSVTCGMLYSLGKVYYDTNQLDKAEKVFLKSIDASKSSAIAVYIHCSLMQLYFEQGKGDKARVHLEAIKTIFTASTRFSLPYTESHYLNTSKAQIYEPMSEQYLMIVDTRKDGSLKSRLAPGALLEFHFPSPTQPDDTSAQSIKSFILPESLDSPITILSDPMEPGPRTRNPIHVYVVEVVIYSDATKATKLGSHYQLFAVHPVSAD